MSEQATEPQLLAQMNASETDTQIETAKRHPRDIMKALANIEAIATLDKETATECFYSLPRDGKAIEGVSVRLAELIASEWGNLRVATHITGNDGRLITVEGVCLDVEKNVAVCVEVKRRITTKEGYTYSDDMQVVTANAASAIAFRNAVLKVIPKAVTNTVINRIRQQAVISEEEIADCWEKSVKWFASKGITKDQLLKKFDIKSEKYIKKEHIFNIRGTMNAIKEGDTTVAELFGAPVVVAAVQDKKEQMRGDSAKLDLK